MFFSEIIDDLKSGHCFLRETWPDNKFIACQVPSNIPSGIVPTMTSLSPSAKSIISEGISVDAPGFLAYHDQVIQVTLTPANIASVTYYIPSWEDIFANDWKLIK